jgi:hypothetical protein
MQQPPPQGLTKTLFGFTPDRQFFAGVAGLTKLTALVVFGAPAHIVDHMLHTGRGVRAYRIIPFVLVSVVLYWISTRLQSTAGDAVFLLWAVFTAKWIAEFIWAILRRGAGSVEHSYHPGVTILSVIGISSLTAGLVLVTLLSLVMIGLAPATMWAVGLIFAFGGLGALVINTYVNTQLAYEEIQRGDMRYAATVETSMLADQERVVYREVRGE